MGVVITPKSLSSAEVLLGSWLNWVEVIPPHLSCTFLAQQFSDMLCKISTDNNNYSNNNNGTSQQILEKLFYFYIFVSNRKLFSYCIRLHQPPSENEWLTPDYT